MSIRHQLLNIEDPDSIHMTNLLLDPTPFSSRSPTNSDTDGHHAEQGPILMQYEKANSSIRKNYTTVGNKNTKKQIELTIEQLLWRRQSNKTTCYKNIIYLLLL